MSTPPEPTHPLAERLAELRAEHGMARYVDDDTLAAWLRPAPARGEPEDPACPTGSARS